LSVIVLSSLLLQSQLAPRDLHSFPTRRSSDLKLCTRISSGIRGENDKLSAHKRARCSSDPLNPWPFRANFPTSSRPFVSSPIGSDRKSTRLNSSHVKISYAVFCLKKKIKYIAS